MFFGTEPASIIMRPTKSTFNTNEVHGRKIQQEKNSKEITFNNPSPYRAPPLGLNCVDVGSGNARITTYTSNPNPGGFNIHIDTWGDTKLHTGGCTIFDEALYDLDYSFGSFDTKDVYPADSPQRCSSKYIRFLQLHAEPPRVVVWLTGFDIHGPEGQSYIIRTYASEISRSGFRVHIDTWGDAKLHVGQVHWIVVPLEKPGVVTGKYSTNDIRHWEEPQMTNTDLVTFGGYHFSGPPRVYVGLTSLDVNCGRVLRLATWCDGIEKYGMMWHINSWADTILYSASVAYIAVA